MNNNIMLSASYLIIVPMSFLYTSNLIKESISRTIVSNSKYRIKQTDVHQWSRVFTETAETKTIQITNVR